LTTKVPLPLPLTVKAPFRVNPFVVEVAFAGLSNALPPPPVFVDAVDKNKTGLSFAGLESLPVQLAELANVPSELSAVNVPDPDRQTSIVYSVSAVQLPVVAEDLNLMISDICSMMQGYVPSSTKGDPRVAPVIKSTSTPSVELATQVGLEQSALADTPILYKVILTLVGLTANAGTESDKIETDVKNRLRKCVLFILSP